VSGSAGRRGSNPLAVVIVLVAVLALYFGLIGYRGGYLVTRPEWTLRLLGVGVLLLPLIGIWVVVAELRFGLASQRLAERLRSEGLDPRPPELPRSPSGRPDRTAADALFAEQRAVVEASPDDWRGWFRLAQIYDLAGDRRRARAALRTAIELRTAVERGS